MSTDRRQPGCLGRGDESDPGWRYVKRVSTASMHLSVALSMLSSTPRPCGSFYIEVSSAIHVSCCLDWPTVSANDLVVSCLIPFQMTCKGGCRRRLWFVFPLRSSPWCLGKRQNLVECRRLAALTCSSFVFDGPATTHDSPYASTTPKNRSDLNFKTNKTGMYPFWSPCFAPPRIGMSSCLRAVQLGAGCRRPGQDGQAAVLLRRAVVGGGAVSVDGPAHQG